jgi:hypothetical protein
MLHVMLDRVTLRLAAGLTVADYWWFWHNTSTFEASQYAVPLVSDSSTKMVPAGCSAATAWHSAAALSGPAGRPTQQQHRDLAPAHSTVGKRCASADQDGASKLLLLPAAAGADNTK